MENRLLGPVLLSTIYYIIIVQSGGKLKSYCMVPIELCGTLEWCHEGRSRDWLDSDIFIEDKTNGFNS